MNSALQCLSHSTAFIEFFLSQRFKADLNRSNPLGSKGKLALSFASLVQQLWGGACKKGSRGAVSPNAFKAAMGSFASQFRGTRQQDSQEFLAYLLDGLHEDLNRIKDKPYSAAPEANEGKDQRWRAEVAWKRHRERNDSIVVDTFQGQYRSTIVCPEPSCQRTSVTFDPFMYLSLPIPDSAELKGKAAARGAGEELDVVVHLLLKGRRAQRYALKLRPDARIIHLQEALARLTLTVSGEVEKQQGEEAREKMLMRYKARCLRVVEIKVSLPIISVFN